MQYTQTMMVSRVPIMLWIAPIYDLILVGEFGYAFDFEGALGADVPEGFGA